jgi:hypothetical protein
MKTWFVLEKLVQQVAMQKEAIGLDGNQSLAFTLIHLRKNQSSRVIAKRRRSK